MKANRNNLAKILGISQRDLDSLTYDIDEHRSKDGMLYNHFVNFYGENDPKILRKIKRLEEGSYVTLDPWEIYEYWDIPPWDDEELTWQINCSDQLEMFHKQMRSVSELVKLPIDDNIQFNLLVMLHAHIVSSFEYFLSSTFISHVTKSNNLMLKLMERDDDLAKGKYTLKDIFTEKDGVKSKVAKHLNEMSFHNINKIAGLFKSVLSFEFIDIDWLCKSIELRHDCVHRAGYKKDNGEAIDISVNSINELIGKCQKMAEEIDAHMSSLRV